MAQKRKILVTGGAGFIGSHLVEALRAEGHDVFVIDNLSTGKRENLPKAVKFYELDVNAPEVGEIFDREKPELVYHLAFNTNVPRAVKEPLYDVRSLTGSLNILENSRRRGVSKIIFSSSGFIYGNASAHPIKETEPFKPISPYSISKYAVEQYLHFYRNSCGLPSVILRFSTVFGPRQIGQAMMDYIRKIAADERAEMYGEKPKTRDYVYVKDVIRVLLLADNDELARHPDPIFNVGSGVETSLWDLYAMIARLLGKDNQPIIKPARPGELERFSLDYSKINQTLGWKPDYDLETGLTEVLKYQGLL